MLRYNSVISRVYQDFNVCSQMINFFISSIQVRLYDPQDRLITLGQAPQEFFFLQKGECLVTTKSASSNLFSDSKQTLIIKQNSYFGEIALLLQTDRTASVTALNYCQIGVIQKQDFNLIIQQFPNLRISMLQNLRNYQDKLFKRIQRRLRGLQIFSTLSQENIQKLSYLFKGVKYKQNEKILSAGRPVQKLLLILSGYAIYQLTLADGTTLPLDIVTPASCVNYDSIWMSQAKQQLSLVSYEKVVIAQITKPVLDCFLESESIKQSIFIEGIKRLKEDVNKNLMRPYPLDWENSHLGSSKSRRFLGNCSSFPFNISSRKPVFKLKNAIISVVLDLRIKRVKRIALYSSSLIHQNTSIKDLQNLVQRMKTLNHQSPLPSSKTLLPLSSLSYKQALELRKNQFNYFVEEEYPQNVDKISKALNSTLENSAQLNQICQFLEDNEEMLKDLELDFDEIGRQVKCLERQHTVLMSLKKSTMNQKDSCSSLSDFSLDSYDDIITAKKNKYSGHITKASYWTASTEAAIGFKTLKEL